LTALVRAALAEAAQAEAMLGDQVRQWGS